MKIIEIIMPKMGESIMEATILNWLKNVGDTVEADEFIVEVATDKIDTEVPSSHAGVLKEILVQKGEVAIIGKPFCLLEVEGTSSNGLAPSTEVVAQKIEKEIAELTGIVLNPIQSMPETVKSGRFYSPLVKTIAKEEGISVNELESIRGTGAEGRVTKYDMLDFLENRKSNALLVKPTYVSTQPSNHTTGEIEIIEMDRMRKMIADRMVASKQVSPHVTSFVETDMTAVVSWREREKANFQQQFGEKITFMPILIEAVVKAIKDFPMINASVDGDKIIVKKDINIGMAVALPNGNLIVPVIHNAQNMNLVDLTKKVNDLSKRARENKLKPADLEGGTYTISNIGTFGNIMGTPIIVQPQIAIMAFGAIQKKPAVVETPEGDFIGIRQKMFISHAYDHRVVDGSLGGMFVKRVSDYFEGFQG